jgi:uncharacterized membrane protein (UPF0127 family)
MSHIALDTLADEIRFCKGLGTARGLMFSPPRDLALVFLFRKTRRVSLHMFFVRFPIDVLYLDEIGTVLEIKRNFRPWSVYRPRCKCRSLIECPAGCTRDVQIGDVITFND